MVISPQQFISCNIPDVLWITVGMDLKYLVHFDTGNQSPTSFPINTTETLVSHTVIEKKQTKHDYKINFSSAVHICRFFLCPAAEERPIHVTALLQKELIPIRNERQYPRLKTAHFRKPRYFIYRTA